MAGGQPDAVSVFHDLHTHGHVDDMESIHALVMAAPAVPTASNMRRYAEILGDAYRSRQLMEAGREIVDLAMTPGATAAEQIDRAQMMLAKLATVKAKRDPQYIHESLEKYIALLQDLSEGKNPAIATGIGGLDKLLNGGMRRGEVMVTRVYAALLYVAHQRKFAEPAAAITAAIEWMLDPNCKVCAGVGEIEPKGRMHKCPKCKGEKLRREPANRDAQYLIDHVNDCRRALSGRVRNLMR